MGMFPFFSPCIPSCHYQYPNWHSNHPNLPIFFSLFWHILCLPHPNRNPRYKKIHHDSQNSKESLIMSQITFKAFSFFPYKLQIIILNNSIFMISILILSFKFVTKFSQKFILYSMWIKIGTIVQQLQTFFKILNEIVVQQEHLVIIILFEQFLLYNYVTVWMQIKK